MVPSPLRVPDDVRFIVLHGIEYYIDWERMLPGRSFFLKTTSTARQVQKKLRTAAQYFDMELKAVQRCEYGYYGVRVWRLT